MPRRSPRRARTENLLKAYSKWRKERSLRERRRLRRLHRSLRQLNLPVDTLDSSDASDIDDHAQAYTLPSLRHARSPSPTSFSETDSSSSLSSSNSDFETTTDWSTLFGSNWRSSGSSHDDDTSESTSSGDAAMPDLESIDPESDMDADEQDRDGMESVNWDDFEELDGEDNSSGPSEDDSSSDWDTGDDGDDEGMEWSPEEDVSPLDATTRMSRRVRKTIDEWHRNRYEVPRNQNHRPPGSLLHTLTVYKHHRPDHFRRDLRVTPATFDALHARIAPDPIFSNNSNNEQMPVDHQLAIALFRFGHSGNGASVARVAAWAGYSTGAVLHATKRVMIALLRRDVQREVFTFPTAEEKEEAKKWVESQSCKAWRGGWLMVDGTLIPLYARPYWYGESYFDRKSNYSLNFQVCLVSTL